MTYITKQPGPGLVVVKSAANLPQTATSTLYTVSGTVLVQWMAGLVTTACGSTATNLSLGVTPTGGSALNTAISTATAITSKAVGTWFVPAFTSGAGAAGVVVTGVTPVLPGSTSQFIVPAGVITWTTSASDTGQMQWYLAYLPVDSGASVS